jgi:hypothetical protein
MMIGFRWIGTAAPAWIVAAGLACLPPAEVAVAASTGYDGTYRGDVTLIRGDSSICGKAAYRTSYTVVNGQFSVVYDASHHVGVNIEIRPDGSFSNTQAYMINARRSQVVATGRVAGNVLDADVQGEGCGRRYHLTKA